jgi:hypothetical protein
MAGAPETDPGRVDAPPPTVGRRNPQGRRTVTILAVSMTLASKTGHELEPAGPFAGIVIAPRHPFQGVALEDYPNQDIATNLFIGSGPYRMTEYKANQYVNFEAWDGYANGTGYRGRPGADKVSIDLR